MAEYASRYRCPDCAQAFSWRRDQPPPDFCPRCGAYVGETPDSKFTPKAPAVHTKHRSLDKVYREMENGSAIRAQKAADILGVPVSDVPNIKITDMKDRPHEGEHSAILPANNQVERLMAQVPRGLAGQATQMSGANFALATREGPHPRAGAQIATLIGTRHAQKEREVQAAFQLNKR